MIILSGLALAWSATLAATAGWAALRTRPVSPPVAPADAMAAESLLLLRPCAGVEPHLDRGLGSSRVAGKGARVRFLVADTTDAAVPSVVRICSDLTAEGYDVGMQVTGARAPNRKAAQLAHAIEAQRDVPGIVVVADSDVELSPQLLADVTAPIAAGLADAAWVPPVEAHPSSAADRASASVLDASLHAFPLLAGIDPGGMVGKLFAIRTEALARVGGFGALVERLGEDVELARRLRRAGLRVMACRGVVPSLASGRSWGDVLRRYARWIGVVRSQRAALLPSYPLLLAATPLIVALSLAAFLREGLAGLAALALALLVRWAIAVLARRRVGRPARGAFGAGLVADAVLLAAFFRAMTTRELEWRGVRLALGGHGLVGLADVRERAQ
jgi:ceramide glucosyltransferase